MGLGCTRRGRPCRRTAHVAHRRLAAGLQPARPAAARLGGVQAGVRRRGASRHELMSHSILGRVSNPTLRVLADLPRQPVSLSESTLILIDCQHTYTRGVMELDGVQEALDEAAALFDRARSAGIPFIHIQHDYAPGSLYDT